MMWKDCRGTYREGDSECMDCGARSSAETTRLCRRRGFSVYEFLPNIDGEDPSCPLFEPMMKPPVTGLISLFPDLPREFAEVVVEMIELHCQKCKDYGSEGDPYANVADSAEWGIEPWVGAMMRMEDKSRRLKEFIKKGTLANESVEDSLLDRTVYSVIALVLYRRSQIP